MWTKNKFLKGDLERSGPTNHVTKNFQKLDLKCPKPPIFGSIYVYLLNFTPNLLFLRFSAFKHSTWKMLKRTISTSFWGAQHPNAGQNIQHVWLWRLYNFIKTCTFLCQMYNSDQISVLWPKLFKFKKWGYINKSCRHFEDFCDAVKSLVKTRSKKFAAPWERQTKKLKRFQFNLTSIFF